MINKEDQILSSWILYVKATQIVGLMGFRSFYDTHFFETLKKSFEPTKHKARTRHSLVIQLQLGVPWLSISFIH